MAGSSVQTTLGDLVVFRSGGTPSKAEPEYWEGTIPWVSAKDMKAFRLFDVQDHISDDGLAAGSRIAPAGSVLLLTRGMTLLSDIPICVVDRPMAFNQDVKALEAGPRLDSAYLPYLLLGRKHELLASVDLAGHGTGRLNTDSLKKLKVDLPPLSEQRRIAHILGTLDDKIELNRRMNATLEEMARALFKSWFVDFDPVRAKAESRDPGLPAHLADLFPDRLVDSELGEIPEGWRQGLLSELVVDLRDSVSPLLTPGEVFEHFSIPAFDDGRQPRIERGASIKSLKLRVSEGAILLSKLNPEIERVWMTDVQLAGRAICSTEFIVLQSPGGFGRAFAYAVMTSTAFRDGIKSRVTGTSGSHQRAGRDGVMRLPVVIPVRDLVASYEMLATPWLDEVSVNQREATALAAIRDALLPRLLCDWRLAMDSSCGSAEG